VRAAREERGAGGLRLGVPWPGEKAAAGLLSAPETWSGLAEASPAPPGPASPLHGGPAEPLRALPEPQADPWPLGPPLPPSLWKTPRAPLPASHRPVGLSLHPPCVALFPTQGFLTLLPLGLLHPDSCLSRVGVRGVIPAHGSCARSAVPRVPGWG